MITPKYLKKSDKIAVISPAGNTSASLIDQGIETLQSWGLQVDVMPHVYNKFHQFSGTDNERLNDFQQAINNKEYKAIICVRGGYGCTRIVDNIDFSSLLTYPKWLVGFSDITVFHAQLNNLGIESIHGAMVKTLSHGGESLKNALFGKLKNYEIPPHPMQKIGKSEGELIGGNLSLLTNIIGTKCDINYHKKVLFIEDLNEQLYHLDRMMVQMKRCGKFENLSGLIVGNFSDMKDCDTPFGKNAQEIILEHVENYNFPIIFGFPAGHTDENKALIFGRKITLNISEKGAKIKFL